MLAGAIVNPRVLNPAHPNARLLRRQGIIMRRMGAVTPPPAVASVDTVPPSDESAVDENDNTADAGSHASGRSDASAETAEPEPTDSTTAPEKPVTDPNAISQ